VLFLRKEFIKLFKEKGICAIICPVGTPALNHTKNSETISSILYTYIWNLLDFPAGIVPVCRVEDNELHYKNS
jgi:fatty acid amide hydrolase